LNIIFIILSGVLLYNMTRGNWIFKKAEKLPVEKIETVPVKEKEAPKKIVKLEEPVAAKPLLEGALLKISSEPADAKIFINGYLKGKTPQEIAIGSVSKSAKEYVIKVTRDGFASWEKKVKLVSGDRKRFEITLKKR